MKELEEVYIGKGQVKGFVFTQLEKSAFAYTYEVNTGDNIFYEVFYRRENNRFNCVSRPTNNAFGVWAWTFKNREDANNKFDELELNSLNKIKEVSNG